MVADGPENTSPLITSGSSTRAHGVMDTLKYAPEGSNLTTINIAGENPKFQV